MSEPQPTHALPRTERIRRRPDFLLIQKQGARTRGRYLTLIGVPGQSGASRLGIVAPKRLGNALHRNRSKRRVRELFRHTKPTSCLDLVVLPRPEFAEVPFSALVDDYHQTLSRQIRAHRAG